MIVANTDATIKIFFGAKGVTATNGIPLAAGLNSGFIPTGDAIYATGASGNPVVSVLEVT